MTDFDKDKIDTLAQHLQNLYADDDYEFDGAVSFTTSLDDEGIKYLNDKVDLANIVGCDADQVLQVLFQQARQQQTKRQNFIYYLLLLSNLDKNLTAKDSDGNTLFVSFAKNALQNKPGFNQYHLSLLLRHGYEMTNEDKDFIKTVYPDIKGNRNQEKTWSWLRLRTLLEDEDCYNTATYDENLNTILSIASLKKGRSFGFGFNNLIQVMNNAIDHYTENGDMILRAIEVYKTDKEHPQRTHLISEAEARDSYIEKRSNYLRQDHQQNEEMKAILLQLFPELDDDGANIGKTEDTADKQSKELFHTGSSADAQNSD